MTMRDDPVRTKVYQLHDTLQKLEQLESLGDNFTVDTRTFSVTLRRESGMLEKIDWLGESLADTLREAILAKREALRKQFNTLTGRP